MRAYLIHYNSADIVPVESQEDMFTHQEVVGNPYPKFAHTFQEAKAKLTDYWQYEMQEAKDYLDLCQQKLMNTIRLHEATEEVSV